MLNHGCKYETLDRWCNCYIGEAFFVCILELQSEGVLPLVQPTQSTSYVWSTSRPVGWSQIFHSKILLKLPFYQQNGISFIATFVETVWKFLNMSGSNIFCCHPLVLCCVLRLCKKDYRPAAARTHSQGWLPSITAILLLYYSLSGQSLLTFDTLN